MPADVQSIVSFITVSETSIRLIMPPAARRTNVRMLKKVNAALSAASYILGCIARGLNNAATITRRIIYRQNMAKYSPNTTFPSKIPKKSGEYNLYLYATRQNGIIIARETILRSRASLTLASRLKHSLHLNMHAMSDGYTLTRRLRRSRQIRNENNTSTSKSISVPPFDFIPKIFENGSDTIPEISLNGDLPVFGTSSDSALHLKHT